MKINQPLMTVMKSYPFKRRKKDAGVLNVRLILASTFKDVIIMFFFVTWFDFCFEYRFCSCSDVVQISSEMPEKWWFAAIRSIALISKRQLLGEQLVDDSFIVLFAHRKKWRIGKICMAIVRFGFWSSNIVRFVNCGMCRFIFL